MDPFTRAYIAAALWSSNDESDESGGDPFDANYDGTDIAPETLAENAEDIASGCARPKGADWDDAEQAGHDFWLTRCGHGAGFWDGDWKGRQIDGKDAGDRLTEASEAFGNVDLYLGDDGKIYSM